jgi:hypothetical protein
MNDERLHIPEGIPETERKLKEKKADAEKKGAAEGSADSSGEGGPIF